ncbi:hypothetical protein PC119_g17465 [Phytophthora cactorum]|uniref:Uncharacterized protein n=1 Tax=Phytophthora cactorum TaxID=29920 RepID=A0A8T1EJM6_9STRA|nr:hypothetical protein PC114_g11195 [Phytophthora cactorum]KAG2953880.1 hypothetical protein PC117_g1655 [Phytophthora cactorum]KAG2998321.1 hypothetical protein PC119_g17465 [Phytophthora cactorum]KAG3183424.1 hypothetical protein PC128_g14176 [Phytophthora cactorum]KAG4051701.1 hypothetical protein PC123_g13102 [Phytophthora cactorum]
MRSVRQHRELVLAKKRRKFKLCRSPRQYESLPPVMVGHHHARARQHHMR